MDYEKIESKIIKILEGVPVEEIDQIIKDVKKYLINNEHFGKGKL
jgi:hypothetical protein